MSSFLFTSVGADTIPDKQKLIISAAIQNKYLEGITVPGQITAVDDQVGAITLHFLIKLLKIGHAGSRSSTPSR